MKHKYIKADKKFLSLFAMAFLALCLPVLSGCDGIIPPHADVPEITYAEFPVTVVYEMDGEIITLNDTMICEYAGETWDGSQYERYRKWDMRFESGKDLVLKRLSETEYLSAYGTVYDTANICVTAGGSAAYWMGDEECPSYGKSMPTGVLIRRNSSGAYHGSYIESDELYEKYGIRIISVDTASPIENTFTPAE